MILLHLAEYILPFINGIHSVAYSFYVLVLTIGHIIISIIIKTFNFSIRVISATSSAFHVLQEDFEFFKNDLLDICSPALRWVADLAKSFVFLQQCYALILSNINGFSEAIRTLFHVCFGLKVFLENACILMVDSLCLVGSAAIYCVDAVREAFLIETYARLARNLEDIIVSKTNFIFRQEVLFGFLIIVCLTFISFKSKLHLKTVALMRYSLYELGTASNSGCILFFKIIGALVKSSGNSFRKTRDHFSKFFQMKKTFPKDIDSDLQRLLEQEKAEKLCVICMDRKRNMILLDCQHLILCNICLSTVIRAGPSCPVCRRFISDAIMVYT